MATTDTDAQAIAVVGVAGRFPGAENVDLFWRNLRDGVESVTELDDEQLLARGADPTLLGADGYVRAQVLLDGIDEFDAGFFGYSPRDAAILDPQHRLFLETAWHALEDAGCLPERFAGSIGVFGGASMSGYLSANLLGGRTLDASPDSLQLIFANDKDYLATRVSYQFNLDGPAISVQTACSTSLVAVHLAAQALLNYECDAALAGGVTVRVPHGIGYQYREGSIFSPDGHCRPFDARANGTTVGSGAGAVVLKRLDDALADGDRIDAVLLGSAVNNDGSRKVGYTAPSVEGQARAIAAALAVADVSPDTIGAIEAHGTGTQLGDPIEVAALTKVFGGAERGDRILLGSVKSNIGHLDSAAGIAAFIKAVLQLRHGELVPSLNFSEPNPEIDFEHAPFEVATSTTGWKANGNPRRIGVSSFGFGGTNAHAVLEEAPPAPSAGPARPVHVLTISARTKEALKRQTESLARALADGAATDLSDVARTLQTARREFRHRRIAVVAGNAEPAAVADLVAGQDPDRVMSRLASADAAPYWLFPGQGSQYPGMGAGLYADHPVYRRTVDECAELLHSELGLDLRELLAPSGDAELLRQTRFTQPALFVVQTALARLLLGWGLRPQAMLGHSIGEITAAHLAGVLELPDALRLVAVRGRLMQEQPTGAMAAVGLAEDTLRADLPDGLAIAAVNAPELCVLSGPHDEVAAFRETLAGQGIDSTPLHTSHAFHSAAMRPAAEGVAELLRGLELHEPRIPIVSNRTGDWLSAEQATDPGYWAGQLLDPVRFADGVERLTRYKPDPPLLLEVGPGHTLTSLAKVCPSGRQAATVTTMRAPNEDGDDATLLATALGRLWLSRVEVDWAAVDGHVSRRRARLPGYAFDRRRYWVDARPGVSSGGALDLSISDSPADEEGAAELGNRPELDVEFRAPETDLQHRLAAIWTDLLGVSPVGLDDPFLELGGHSLLAVKVVQRIESELGITIPLRRLMKAGTVATLAELVIELGGAPASAQPTEEPRAELPGVTPDPERLYEPFPLSEMQQAQWIGRRSNFQLGNVAAQVYFEVEARGADVEALQRAWNAVEARHLMLHGIVTDDGTQRILPDVGPYQIEVVDLTSAGDAEDRLAELRDRLSHTMRPTDRWPLFDIVAAKLPGDRLHVLISFDLLIADIGSIRIVLRDWGRAYAGQELMPLGLSYRDYVLAAGQVRETAQYQRSLEYWRERVTQLPAAPQLPQAKNPAEVGEPRFVARGRLLPQETWDRLTERGARHGLTPSAVLMAAYGAVLGSWCRESRFTLNATVINRFPLHPDVDELVGEFASFDLLPVDLTAGTFTEIAAAVQEQSWEDLEYRSVNGVEVLRELARARGGTAGAVMPVVFTSTLVQETEGAGESLLGWLGEIVHEGAQTPQVWVDGAVLKVSGGVYLSWIGVDELFPDELLGTMLDEYVRLLTDLSGSDEPWRTEPRSNLPEPQRNLIDAVNETSAEVPDGLLHEGLLRQSRRRPDAPAVIGADAELTYGALRAHACALANRLRSLGVGPGQLVGVALPKGAAQVVGALGVLLAGGAYLPVDPDLPVPRQDRLLELGGCRLVVRGDDADREPWPDGVTAIGLDITQEPADAEAPESVTRPDDLAYVIFTSGSTGEPKGVAVSHRAALNTCVDICDRFEVGPDDRVLGLSSLSFDLSVWDIFGVLGAGGTVVLPETEARRDPARWLELVRRHGITVWNSVPALAQMFADHVHGGEPVPVRLALLSGDWIPLDLPDRIRAVAPDCRVISLGGATEAAVWSIYYEIGAVDPAWDSVPYGRPLRNQRFHVLNDRWQECPVHVTGELFIAGVGLAQGYYGDAERTAAAFVHHPVTGERLYRTGDLGRWRPDGTIEFLGREDFQVKVGGYRIELGEIEAAMTEHAGVRAAVVAALGDRHHRRLVGYVVPHRESDTLIAELTEHLRDRLPAYMVPPTVVALDRLPLTSNGKVDRGALPDPAATQPGQAAAAEEGAIAAIAAIVASVVGVAEIDPDRNFLEAGGDSIGAVQIVSRANEEGIDLTLQDLFEQPTIRQAAAAVQARSATLPGSTGARQRLPLSPGQEAILARGETGPRWTAISVARDVDPELAGRATAYLINRHPALRLRLVEDGENRWQTIDPETEDTSYVPLIELTALPEARRQAAFEAMLAEMGEELDPVSGPVVRTALFALDDQHCELVWLAHPLVLDETSWAPLVEETRRLLSGDEIDRPAPGAASLSAWLRATSERAWSGQVADESTVDDLVLPSDGESGTAGAWLTAEETEELGRTALAAYRMPLEELCFAAVIDVLAAEHGQRRACVGVERDGRHEVDNLDLAGSVGPYVLGGTTSVVLPERTETAALLTLAKERYRALAEPDPEATETILVRWLGSVPDRPQRTTDSGRPMAVTAAIAEGRLGIEWTARADTQRLAEAAAEALRAILRHCRTANASLHPSDFPLSGLDSNELTSVLEGLEDVSR